MRNFERYSRELLTIAKTGNMFDYWKRLLLEQLLDMRTETSLLIEIRDIRDEINIIRSILTIQKGIVDKMMWTGGDSDPLLSDNAVQDLVHTNLEEIEKLDGQAVAVQQKVRLLDVRCCNL